MSLTNSYRIAKAWNSNGKMKSHCHILLSIPLHPHFYSSTLPYTKFRLHSELASVPATSLAFNPRLPLLAVGVGDGSTQVWRLPVTLTERVPRALQILNRIAGEEGAEKE